LGLIDVQVENDPYCGTFSRFAGIPLVGPGSLAIECHVKAKNWGATAGLSSSAVALPPQKTLLGKPAAAPIFDS
jgi:hypothetical protein